jgi:N-acetylglucosaminyldiphosphoundecaprenol N-acetyl-beta-D-mannosaminyltransferase
MDHPYISSASDDVAAAESSVRPVIQSITPQDPFDRNVFCILGLPFDAVDRLTALARIQAAIDTHARCFLSTPNLNFVIASQQDAALRNSIIHSDLSVPDGMPIVWVARLLGLPVRERVAGSTLFSDLQSQIKRPVNVYFFGGPEGVAAEASRVINRAAGAMKCVGHECPGFGPIVDMSSESTIDRINAANADFLVVSLGARKGQAWIEHNLSRLRAPIVSHLGAVVNFVAGTVVRSPAWLQQLGLEWLWRIKEEPALLRRYVSDGWKFLRVLRKQVLPYAWFLLVQRADWRRKSGDSMNMDFEWGTATLILKGRCDIDNIEQLRTGLKKCRDALRDVKLELNSVTYVDSAFLGLLTLLRKHQDANGLRLTLVGTTSHVRKIFYWNGADFLIEHPEGLAVTS